MQERIKMKDIPAKHQIGDDKIPQRKIVEDTPQLMRKIKPTWEKWWINL